MLTNALRRIYPVSTPFCCPEIFILSHILLDHSDFFSLSQVHVFLEFSFNFFFIRPGFLLIFRKHTCTQQNEYNAAYQNYLSFFHFQYILPVKGKYFLRNLLYIILYIKLKNSNYFPLLRDFTADPLLTLQQRVIFMNNGKNA